jgi:hypothetical protein
MIDQTALERCNRLFRSRQYRLLADHIAADLQLPRSAPRVSDGMNAVTDTALSLCGHGFYAHAWRKLATFCGENRVSAATVDQIYRYLLVYRQAGDTRAEDFAAAAKALLLAHRASSVLEEALSCVCSASGGRERAARELLAAAQRLTRTAALLLAADA